MVLKQEKYRKIFGQILSGLGQELIHINKNSI